MGKESDGSSNAVDDRQQQKQRRWSPLGDQGSLPDGQAKCCQVDALARQHASAFEHAIWKRHVEEHYSRAWRVKRVAGSVGTKLSSIARTRLAAPWRDKMKLARLWCGMWWTGRREMFFGPDQPEPRQLPLPLPATSATAATTAAPTLPLHRCCVIPWAAHLGPGGQEAADWRLWRALHSCPWRRGALPKAMLLSPGPWVTSHNTQWRPSDVPIANPQDNVARELVAVKELV
ncbi:hypothetical protein BKA66DRAFT_439965 [Pyrenochaeta sp. MPI-SDFR-AT-0127]|nr:hypothetical protein BKA66DRAFT_439965 [Pyrenochaeta sp. MPI-SDFR-AT-0127]